MEQIAVRIEEEFKALKEANMLTIHL